LASTRGEFFFAYQQILQVGLLTLSTVAYPIETVQKVFPSLSAIVSANPLSLAAYALRNFTFNGMPIDPGVLLGILLSSIPFTIIGAVAYSTALHRLRVKGKL
jgi:ABC-type polysaccharide/polyol phosphate export permease